MQSTVHPIKHDCLIFQHSSNVWYGSTHSQYVTKSRTVCFEKNKGKYIQINRIKAAVIISQTEHILFVKRS